MQLSNSLKNSVCNPFVLGWFMLAFGSTVWASSDNAKVISSIEMKSKMSAKATVVALINMDEVLPDCHQQVTKAKIKGVIYSESGMTPEKIRFDWQGNSVELPTNINENPILSLEDIHAANQFIQVGKRYLIHFQLCRDGLQRSLINMYEEPSPSVRTARKKT